MHSLKAHLLVTKRDRTRSTTRLAQQFTISKAGAVELADADKAADENLA